MPKKNLDPSLKDAVIDGKNVTAKAMTKQRGRPRKGQGKTPSRKARTIDKHVRFTDDEWDVMKKKMEHCRTLNFSEYIRRKMLNLRPIIISTEDFTELRKARRDFVNFINATGIKNLTPEMRKEVLKNEGTLYDWADHLQGVVESVNRLLDRIHYKAVTDVENEDKEDVK